MRKILLILLLAASLGCTTLKPCPECKPIIKHEPYPVPVAKEPEPIELTWPDLKLTPQLVIEAAKADDVIAILTAVRADYQEFRRFVAEIRAKVRVKNPPQ